MRWREQQDGTLVAPQRGEPPECPDGYESDGAYQCKPVLPECGHRSLIQESGGCCGNDSVKLVCDVIDKSVTRLLCKNCEGRVQWIKKYG